MKGTQSLERAIHILRLFDDEQSDWSLQDLVEQTGLTKTTVFRMLTTLKHEGFLEQADKGTWCLGSELIMLGGRAMRRNRFRAVANDQMRQLARETGESATVDVLWIDENSVPFSMVVDEAVGRHMLGMTQYIGARLPAHATSTGKAMLAFLTADELDVLNFKKLQRMTDDTIISRKVLLEELETVRTVGYGTTMHEIEVGVMGIAAPIFDHHGYVRASISVTGPSSRISTEQLHGYSSIILKAADAVSAQIGYRPLKPTHSLKTLGGSKTPRI